MSQQPRVIYANHDIVEPGALLMVTAITDRHQLNIWPTVCRA